MATTRVVLRIVFVIVAVAISLYLLYLLRRPIGWILIALFLAVALSGPVNWLSRRMRRGAAIALVYLGMLTVPVLIGLVVVPPIVTEASNLVDNLPQYAADVREFVSENDQLRRLEEDYDITGKIEEEAAKLPDRLGGAAGALSDIGLGLVNSIFALITILVLAAFMLGSGHRWFAAALRFAPEQRRDRVERAARHMGTAVGGYVAGALSQALVAGVLSYLVLIMLGVPFAAPLALIVALADLIPLVGATIGAVLVGIVTLFNDFPTATIVWTIWSIVYQQLENTVIQPQIQKRAVNVHPFVVMVAVLFGATLLGVVGALVAIPVAASIQIALDEWLAMRREREGGVEPPKLPPQEPPKLPPRAPPAPA